MKHLIVLLLTLSAIHYTAVAQVSLMTYNIRYDNPGDGDNWWEYRKHDVIAVIKRYQPEILGIQEGLDHQVGFLNESLTDYQYVGIGRDGKGIISEFTAIFYDTTKYNLIDTKTFWLSPTPDVVSKGWDAALNRISTYASFEERTSGAIIHVFNAHFDHIGEEARENSARLIVDQINKWNLQQQAVVVMGDFNSTPNSKAIAHLQESLTDTRTALSQKPSGPAGTFTGFDKEAELLHQIDYIFMKNMTVFSQRHIDDLRPNLLWPSDHLPVYAVLNFLR